MNFHINVTLLGTKRDASPPLLTISLIVEDEIEVCSGKDNKKMVSTSGYNCLLICPTLLSNSKSAEVLRPLKIY